MIVFSDLHLTEASESVVFDQVLPGLAEAAIYDTERIMACLGDLYHLRYRVSVRLQNRLVEYFESLSRRGVTVYLLPGNHDQINVAGESALDVLGRIPGVIVFTKPTWNSYGLWIPYRKNIDDFMAANKPLDIYDKGRTRNILWAHIGVMGAWKTSTLKDTDGISLDALRKWEDVFSGHYHAAHIIGNVTYVGSPYQITASEAGQQKGYMVFNESTDTIDFVPANWGKKYYQLGVVDSIDKLPTDMEAGDELRITGGGIDIAKILEVTNRTGVRVIVTPQVQANSAQRLAVAPNASIEQYARAYVDQFAGALDKGRLIELFQKMKGA